MQTCNIMGVNIAVTDMDKTLRLVEDNCEAWRGKYICVANVHTTVTAHDGPASTPQTHSPAQPDCAGT